MVQHRHHLSKYDLNVLVAEDMSQVVEVSDDVFQESVPLWEDFRIGNFLHATPHIAKVHVIVNKI